jgi:acyl-CoA reductase-like NAD-dependent aldehyde dehydrogenase
MGTGENCNAGSRVLVHASLYETVVSQLTATARSLRVCSPLDPACQMGALISAGHRDRVHALVQQGVAAGARLVTGGHALPGDGFFYAPTVLADVAASNPIFTDEVFGPVVTVTPFADDDDAMQLANATGYGLAAGVWTSSVERALRCTREIRAGYVWVNTYNSTPVEVPFGGHKGSGFGRDCGVQALDNYTQWKTTMWATAPFQPYYPQP